MTNEYKNKIKGFTLVELLAVLTILATILLLVVPTVLNVIKKSETAVDKENITRYGRAIKQAVLEYQLDSNEPVEGIYIYDTDDNYLINIKNSNVSFKLTYEGNKINCGVIMIDSYGEVFLDECKINNKKTEYTYGESKNFSTTPDLFDGTLTPVTYDGSKWVVADPNRKWYDYNNQEWANAVILNKDVEKNIGDSVSVDGTNPDVLAMYVWIPRYEYKIEGTYGKGGSSVALPGEIQINFLLAGQIKASDGYIIHPAFKFGGTQLNGIWVGKFEMSHSSGTSKNMYCSNETCAEGDNLRVLPNAISLGHNTTSSFFYGIRSMGKSSNIFGIDKNITDSHMIKNVEWGAIAYLSQSKYGKYGNPNYSGTSKEVYINNSSGFYTGRSEGGVTGTSNTAGTYKYDVNKYGTGASTTGNIYGIYDMSGGGKEYVMAVLANSSGELWAGASGFVGKKGTEGTDVAGLEWPDIKYYDIHRADNGTSFTTTPFCHSGICYGHAVFETKGWYSDNPYLETPSYPWLYRGEYYGSSKSGVFASSAHDGGAMRIYTTRPILTAADSPATQTKNYKNGEIVYYDVATGKKCTNYNSENSKTGYNGINNKTGNQNSCLKFYAFNDNNSYYLNLILDHNTTATSLWNTNGDNSTGPTEVLKNLKEQTQSWKGTIEPTNYTTGASNREYTVNYNGYKARIISANEIAQITENIGWDENSKSTDKFYFDTKINSQSATCKEGDTTGCRYGWLYDRTSKTCTTTGCLNNSNIETNGYWTISSSTTLSSVDIHKEYCNGYVNYGVSDSARLSITCPNYPNHFGVRPVIEVLKSNLQ